MGKKYCVQMQQELTFKLKANIMRWKQLEINSSGEKQTRTETVGKSL